MKPPARREIAGTGVSITDYAQVLDFIDAAVAERFRAYICFAPASTLMFARRDRALAHALAEADIVAPDGMGVVYAARALGETIGDRVYGPDLMELQMERAADAGTPVYLVGGHDDAALGKLRAVISERWPGVVIAGCESPPHRTPTEAETRETVQRINGSGAQIVWVGLGSPKQELWMSANRAALDAPVLLGVGAAFDFLIGRVAQAPDWMQNRGLEWLYRVIKDPLRLGRRYLITLPAFVFAVARQKFAGR